MVYIDTSVLVAYYSPEPLSEKVEAFLRDQDGVAISSLTELELFSALSRKVREGQIEKADARKIAARFLSHVDGSFFEYLPVEPHHFRLARDWIALFDTGLRSLDGLHLAIVSSIGAPLVTADLGLAQSAKCLGMDTILLQ
jgi:predicted nucleic acid-binding protein